MSWRGPVTSRVSPSSRRSCPCSTGAPAASCGRRSTRRPRVAEVILEGVSKRLGRRLAVADLSLRVTDGEFIVLLGPTGAGKTTTLRLVAGLERPDAGRVSIGDRDITAEPPSARDVAFVFQQYSLYPHLSGYANLAFPLRSPARRLAEDQVRTRVRGVARLLHLQ